VANTIAISVLAETAKARQGIDDINGRLGKVGSFAKKAAVGFVAFQAAGGAVNVLKNSVGEAISAVREQDKLLGQSNAVIKSTGGAAGVTASQVVKLSEAMERKSTVDAEVIQNGANVLLTFTKVRNEAGKGNDIFNQGTQAALDMSAALGTSMASASTLVGKALNDPIKGVSALGRSGVQFTADQKKTIASMVETGDQLGAQKIILKELNTQFAGSAGADKFGIRVKRLKDTFDGWIEAGVRKGMPIVEQLVGVLETKLPAAISTVTGAADKIAPAFTNGYNAIQPVISFLANNKTVVAVFVGTIGTLVGIIKVWTLTQAALNIVMTANPIGLVVVAIAALAAGLTYAYQRSATFRAVVQGVFAAVSAAAGVAKGIVVGGVRAIGAGFRAAGAVIRGAVSLYLLPFRLVAAGARAIWPAVRSALGNVGSAFRGLPAKIKGAVSGAGGWLKSAGGDVVRGFISGIRGMAGSLVRAIKSYVTDKIPGPVKKALGIASPSKLFRSFGRFVMQGLTLGITGNAKAPVTAVQAVARDIARTPITPLSLTPARVKAKADMAPVGYLSGTGHTVIKQNVNIRVQLDNTMTEAQMGVQYDRAIRAAERTGLVIRR
jgi:hypothetical protein